MNHSPAIFLGSPVMNHGSVNGYSPSTGIAPLAFLQAEQPSWLDMDLTGNLSSDISDFSDKLMQIQNDVQHQMSVYTSKSNESQRPHKMFLTSPSVDHDMDPDTYEPKSFISQFNKDDFAATLY